MEPGNNKKRKIMEPDTTMEPDNKKKSKIMETEQQIYNVVQQQVNTQPYALNPMPEFQMGEIQYDLLHMHLLTLQFVSSQYMIHNPVVYLGYYDALQLKAAANQLLRAKLQAVANQLSQGPLLMLMYVSFKNPPDAPGKQGYEHPQLSALVINTSEETPTFEIFVPFSCGEYNEFVKNTFCQIMKVVMGMFVNRKNTKIPETHLQIGGTVECQEAQQRAGIYKMQIPEHRGQMDVTKRVQLNMLVFWFVINRGFLLDVNPDANNMPWSFARMNRIFESIGYNFSHPFMNMSKNLYVGLYQWNTSKSSALHLRLPLTQYTDKHNATLINTQMPVINHDDVYNLVYTHQVVMLPETIQNSVWFPETLESMDETDEEQNDAPSFEISDAALRVVHEVQSSIQSRGIEVNMKNYGKVEPLDVRFGVDPATINNSTIQSMAFNMQ